MLLFRRFPKPTKFTPTACSSTQTDVSPDADKSSQNVAEVLDKSAYPPKPMSSAMQRRAQIISSSKPKSIFKYRPVLPTNWSYPNPKCVEFYDEDIRVGDIPKEVNEYVKLTGRKIKEELHERVTIENPHLANDIFRPAHNQLQIEYEFKSDDAMSRWQTGCDSDWGEGFSTVQLEKTDRNTAIFSGFLDTTVIKSGRIEKAGWCTMKSVDVRAFNRKSFHKTWEYYNQLLIKCRGDGRSYKVILYTPGSIDLSWGDAYSYPLHTHGGPYWQYTRISFSRFFHTVGGRIQDVQKKIPLNMVSNIGIVLMDRMDGKFRLEVDYIGVCNDMSHQEEDVAYEGYSIPVYNTNSI